MLDKCWCGMIWLDADVDTLYVKKIGLLYILLFIALCVKTDPNTHKGMHSVLALKLGVTKVASKPCWP
jgi:hypothetical protein